MSVSLLLLCLLLTSARRSDRISPVSVLIQGYRAMFVFSVCRLVSRRCHNISTIPSGSDTLQTSRGKTQSFPRVNAGFIKHTPMRMEDFVVTCPLVPDVPHLRSGSCTSSRAFGLGFLQTPPRDDAPGSSPGQALALFTRLWRAPSLGPSQRLRPHKSARSFDIAQDKLTWRGDFHPTSPVPCPAHTLEFSGRRRASAGMTD